MNPLKNLSDEKLEEEIKTLVIRERELLVSILEHLREVDDRQLFLRRGYGSLFDYATGELGYAEASAARRIHAMRFSRQLPEVHEKIESGALTLSNVAAVQVFLKREIRDYSLSEKKKLLEQVENKSHRECQKVLLALSPEPVRAEKERQISPTQTEIRFVADERLMTKLERLKSLLSHQLIDPTYAELFEKMADQLLKKLDPDQKPDPVRKLDPARKPDPVRKPDPEIKAKTTPTSESAKDPAYIPAAVRRAVWKRSPEGCQHRDPKTDRRCGSRFQLQIDHIMPLALGGKTELQNLELVCRQHNLLRASQLLGAELMGKYWKRSSA